MSTSVARPVDKDTRFQHCPRCDKRRKMRILRTLDDTGLEWLNCLACNGLVCLTLDEETETAGDPRVVGDFGAPAPEEFRTYVPEEGLRGRGVHLSPDLARRRQGHLGARACGRPQAPSTWRS